MTSAVIYARYSSDNQREASIEGQIRECTEFAVRNGLTVVNTYIDRALSARTDQRPQFQQMILDSSTHTFQIVLVWKLDRFSRDRYDSANYKHQLKKNGVRVVSATEAIADTPEGIMLESLLEGLAEYYSADLAQKVNRGLTENALKGKFNGGVIPLGYRINQEQEYEVDPIGAAVVREVFQRYADGEGIKEIVDSLNGRGLRATNGRSFTRNSFQTILKNRRYLGEYRYRDTVIEHAIPAIISPELFDTVQRRRERNKMAPAHTKTDVNYMLTTKLFCGNCGTMLIGESGTSKTGATHYYYKCGMRKRRGAKVCDLKPIQKDRLEEFVVRVTIDRVLNEESIDALIQKLVILQGKENTRLPVLRAQLKQVEKRIDNLINAIEQGIFTASTQQRLEELEQQKEELEINIQQELMEKPLITPEFMKLFFGKFQGSDPKNPHDRQQIIDCFINSVFVFPDKILINFNMRDNEGKIVSFEEVKSSLSGGDAPPKTHRFACGFSFCVQTEKTPADLSNPRAFFVSRLTPRWRCRCTAGSSGPSGRSAGRGCPHR